MSRAFLIVKLAALGDVLLATVLAHQVRRAHPRAHIAWLTSPYAAPVLDANPDLDEVLLASTPRLTWHQLLHWRRRHPAATVLIPHRAFRLYALLLAAGFSSSHMYAWGRSLPYRSSDHRLQQYRELLEAAHIPSSGIPLAPVLHLRWDEIALGEHWWAHALPGQPRLVLAPGGARNPWSSMPNRRWPLDRFLDLAARAHPAGIALCWMGGPEDAPLLASLVAQAPPGARVGFTDHLSLRRSAAVLAAADFLIGNDSLPLVLAHALVRPALGLYGPTSAAHIHAPGQPAIQGRVPCGPCYDSRQGLRGLAYRCPLPACMQAIAVDHVWRAAQNYLLHSHGRAAHA